MAKQGKREGWKGPKLNNRKSSLGAQLYKERKAARNLTKGNHAPNHPKEKTNGTNSEN